MSCGGQRSAVAAAARAALAVAYPSPRLWSASRPKSSRGEGGLHAGCVEAAAMLETRREGPAACALPRRGRASLLVNARRNAGRTPLRFSAPSAVQHDIDGSRCGDGAMAGAAFRGQSDLRRCAICITECATMAVVDARGKAELPVPSLAHDPPHRWLANRPLWTRSGRGYRAKVREPRRGCLCR